MRSRTLGDRVVAVLVSPWFFLAYGLTAIFYMALSQMAKPRPLGNLLSETVGLLTGSDPFTFKDTIYQFQWVWVVAWVIHVMSWLILPAIVGLVVSKSMERAELQQRQRRNREMEALVEGFVSEFLAPEETNEVVREIMGEIRESEL